MKLHTLTLQDFKGVSHFSAVFAGQDATVYGQNGAGKSTLANALLWLLTGKDAQGRENHHIKPLKEDGTSARQGMEPTVEAVFLPPNGATLTLRRSLVEKWSARRGHSEVEYRGDETRCWVDDVPKSVTEYGRAVAAHFADETLLRLLTSTAYFNTQIDSAARRRLLMDAFGDVDDADILKGDEQFAPLAGPLARRTLPDLVAMLNEQRKRANVALESLPVRMDEAAKQLAPNVDGPAAEQKAAALREQLHTLQRQAAAEDPAAALKAELAAKQQTLAALDQAHRAETQQAAARQERQQAEARQQAAHRLAQAQQAQDAIAARLATQEKLVTTRRGSVLRCRQSWSEENARSFTADEHCPTCGQPFPPQHVDALRANWNEARARRLAAITAQGEAEASQLAAEEKALAALQGEEAAARHEVTQARQALAALEAEAAPFQQDEQATAAYLRQRAGLAAAVAGLETALEAQAAGKGQGVHAAEIEALQAQLAALQTEILQAAQNQQVEARLAEYDRQQTETLRQREEAERLLYLCEAFTRAKVARVTQHISGHFQLVRFKLFENQKNGGLKQTCEVTVNGVPYDALNRARKVAASLDVIAAFAKRYSCSFPIFIDDAEGVYETYGVSTGAAQRITLIATQTDEALRVEPKA